MTVLHPRLAVDRLSRAMDNPDEAGTPDLCATAFEQCVSTTAQGHTAQERRRTSVPPSREKVRMADEYISIKHLAEKLGMDRSHARRYVLKLGFKPQKRRTVDSGNQLTLTVTEQEAESILKRRQEQGFTAEGKPVESESGVFYVIQLVPELDPRRIKLGFAVDLNDRLVQHRTAAPTARVAKSWPCRRSWETTVMDCLSSVACRHILSEVFECTAIDDLIARGNELFTILPDPRERPELSEHSPHGK